MKIPQIKIKNGILEQIHKIKTEALECQDEYIHTLTYREHGHELSAKESIRDMRMEALDTLTAAYNLCAMLNISKETYDKWYEKMLRYEKEKGYEIERWIRMEDGE